VDALVQLSFTVQNVLGRIGAAHDLSIVQVRLLGILRDHSPTINELAAYLRVDKSSVTGLVDRAQERGLVDRSTSPLDRRMVQVTITPAGRQLVDAATAAVNSELGSLVRDLSPTQRDRLSRSASVIVAAEAGER
jgi:DNA-binding MarR family transcriptional regulator